MTCFVVKIAASDTLTLFSDLSEHTASQSKTVKIMRILPRIPPHNAIELTVTNATFETLDVSHLNLIWIRFCIANAIVTC
jgi:hypothetical protein